MTGACIIDEYWLTADHMTASKQEVTSSMMHLFPIHYTQPNVIILYSARLTFCAILYKTLLFCTVSPFFPQLVQNE